MQEYHRIVEAILFASTGPVRTKDIKSKLPSDVNVINIIAKLFTLDQNSNFNSYAWPIFGSLSYKNYNKYDIELLFKSIGCYFGAFSMDFLMLTGQKV